LASRDDALRDATDKFIADVIRGLDKFPTEEVTFTLPCTHLVYKMGKKEEQFYYNHFIKNLCDGCPELLGPLRRGLNRRFGRFNNIRVTAELHGQELTLKPI
jgi:hypothetical protein